VSQQKESWAQTCEQHDSSSQEGEPFSLQQSPIPAQVAPLQLDALHRLSARSAQF
jgi:hypothetical protein